MTQQKIPAKLSPRILAVRQKTAYKKTDETPAKRQVIVCLSLWEFMGDNASARREQRCGSVNLGSMINVTETL